MGKKRLPTGQHPQCSLQTTERSDWGFPAQKQPLSPAGGCPKTCRSDGRSPAGLTTNCMWTRVCFGASQTVDLSEEVHELLDCVRPPPDKDGLGNVQQISVLHMPPAPPAAAGPCSLPTLVLGSQMGSQSPDWFAPCAAMGLSPKSGINLLTPM